mmetsp:Transcript_6113/g.9148  ORF Transcript_6113/g.9148 Transcript_6113/m.9148 type:complete len:89 (-) Transcript_6113:112-378(-)
MPAWDAEEQMQRLRRQRPLPAREAEGQMHQVSNLGSNCRPGLEQNHVLRASTKTDETSSRGAGHNPKTDDPPRQRDITREFGIQMVPT